MKTNKLDTQIREILITLSDDWLHNSRADFPDKRANPSNKAIGKITALISTEVAKAKIEGAMLENIEARSLIFRHPKSKAYATLEKRYVKFLADTKSNKEGVEVNE